MSMHKIRRDKLNRTSISIPAYLRDKFNLQDGNEVEVTDENEKIIIVPKRIIISEVGG